LGYKAEHIKAVKKRKSLSGIENLGTRDRTGNLETATRKCHFIAERVSTKLISKGKNVPLHYAIKMYSYGGVDV
jgi:hypothetical protein